MEFSMQTVGHKFKVKKSKFTESGPRVESSKTNSWPEKPTPSWDLKTYQDNHQDNEIGKYVIIDLINLINCHSFFIP